jgi:hypothetical protein
MKPAGDQVIEPAHLVARVGEAGDCPSVTDGVVLRRSEPARLDAAATAHDQVRDHVGIWGTYVAYALRAPPDECRYLIVYLGGVRMPTWRQEPPCGRHVVSVGNG